MIWTLRTTVAATRWRSSMKWSGALTGILLLLSLPSTLLAARGGFLDTDKIREWVNEPKPDNFAVCFNHTCAETAIIGLNASQWQQVRTLFRPAPANAAEERRRITKAIGLFERLVAPKIGTENDKGMNFEGTLAEGNQQDCIDESTNSTTYLTLMQQDGLLRFHKVQETATRGWFFMGLPHTTAVIKDNASGIDYAVDSWFHDNGDDAEILPVNEWWNGWHPSEKKRP
jgi:hypothetical protein